MGNGQVQCLKPNVSFTMSGTLGFYFFRPDKQNEINSLWKQYSKLLEHLAFFVRNFTCETALSYGIFSGGVKACQLPVSDKLFVYFLRRGRKGYYACNIRDRHAAVAFNYISSSAVHASHNKPVAAVKQIIFHELLRI